MTTVTRVRHAPSTDASPNDVHARNERRMRDTLLPVGDQPIVLTSFLPAPAASPS